MQFTRKTTADGQCVSTFIGVLSGTHKIDYFLYCACARQSLIEFRPQDIVNWGKRPFDSRRAHCLAAKSGSHEKLRIRESFVHYCVEGGESPSGFGNRHPCVDIKSKLRWKRIRHECEV